MHDLPSEVYRWLAACKEQGRIPGHELAQLLKSQSRQTLPILYLVRSSGLPIQGGGSLSDEVVSDILYSEDLNPGDMDFMLDQIVAFGLEITDS